MDKHNVHDASRVFNVDDTGIYFKELLVHFNERGLVRSASNTTSILSNTRGLLDHVTMMPAISADGRCHTSVFIFPYTQEPYMVLNDSYKTVHAYLPSHSFLFFRKPAGMDRFIFNSWGPRFVT